MTIETTWGCIEVSLMNGLVAGCALPLLAVQPDTAFAVKSRGRNEVHRFVASALAGKAAPRPSIRPPAGTVFQRQVWAAIAAIPAGETRTYGELARIVGRPRAYRAVANACGRNPLPLFIPCHRVVAANGKLGGFSSGLPWKRHLLAAEQR
jgi:O-6-methylguanine DNA methyltransferase